MKLGTDYSIEKAPDAHPQFITYSFLSDGTQWVWMDAESSQDSRDATIELKPLSGFA